MNLPATIQARLEARSNDAQRDASPMSSSSRLERGDVCVVEPPRHLPGSRRLALILRIEAAQNFAEILPVHSSRDLACHLDGILDRASGCAPYDLVLQTDLRGVIWTNQIVRRVGHLTDPILRELGRVPSDPLADHGALPVGVRLAGPADRRWAFKAAEGASLRHLSHDCTVALLDGHSPWEIDAGLLDPRLLDSVGDRESFLLELLHLIQTRNLTLTLDDLETLEALGALDPETWASVDCGMELWTSFQLVIEESATNPVSQQAVPERRLVTAEVLRRAPRPDEGFAKVHVIGQKELADA